MIQFLSPTKLDEEIRRIEAVTDAVLAEKTALYKSREVALLSGDVEAAKALTQRMRELGV